MPNDIKQIKDNKNLNFIHLNDKIILITKIQVINATFREQKTTVKLFQRKGVRLTSSEW